MILGQKENGSSEEIHSQNDISVVINAETKLEAHNEWWHTVMLMFADVLGSGVLALPGAFARIGCFLGILLLIVCYLMYVTSVFVCNAMCMLHNCNFTINSHDFTPVSYTHLTLPTKA